LLACLNAAMTEHASASPERAGRASTPGRGSTDRPVVAAAARDPGRWGRVGADGTVYVRTADGERAVGNWQAGVPEEGLAHYARRFDDLVTDAVLTEQRLAAGSGDPKQVLARVAALRTELTEPTVVGDLSALATLVEHLQASAEQAAAGAREARERAKAAATAHKEALAEEAERIGTESTQWKAGGDRLRAILDEWKTIKGVDRKTDDALWRRFSKARDAFNRRRGAHFADLDRQRTVARERKEELVAQAEALVDSTDWGSTAGLYRSLMEAWKAAGRASKGTDDTLWARFRVAQDQFFRRRSENLSERDAEFTGNVQIKEALLAEAAAIDPRGGLDAARAQLRRIQERWEAAGKVPRERVKELEARLRAVEERVRSATDTQWRRTDPEAEARVAQFRARVAQFEEQAAKARAAGDEKRAGRAETQAEQWREWLATAEESARQL